MLPRGFCSFVRPCLHFQCLSCIRPVCLVFSCGSLVHAPTIVIQCLILMLLIFLSLFTDTQPIRRKSTDIESCKVVRARQRSTSRLLSSRYFSKLYLRFSLPKWLVRWQKAKFSSDVWKFCFIFIFTLCFFFTSSPLDLFMSVNLLFLPY